MFIISVMPIKCSQLFRGQLLAFENGSKIYPADDDLRKCHSLATNSLNALIGFVVQIGETFIKSNLSVDLTLLPLFSIYLIYKAAVILTNHLRRDDMPANNLRRLKALRQVLQTVSQRWLSAGKKRIVGTYIHY